jgi:hypothetical protein
MSEEEQEEAPFGWKILADGTRTPIDGRWVQKEGGGWTVEWGAPMTLEAGARLEIAMPPDEQLAEALRQKGPFSIGAEDEEP